MCPSALSERKTSRRPEDFRLGRETGQGNAAKSPALARWDEKLGPLEPRVVTTRNFCRSVAAGLFTVVEILDDGSSGYSKERARRSSRSERSKEHSHVLLPV